VSAGYLRYFAVDDQLRLIELDGTVDRLAGVRDVFTRRNFSVVDVGSGPDDQLEREWEHLEDLALPKLRGLSLGMPLIAAEEGAIKIMVALHFARSYGVDAAAKAAWDAIVVRYQRELPTNAKLVDAFHEDYGRAPDDGELEAIVRQHADHRTRSNVLWVSKQAEYYNRMLDYLGPLRTQRGIIRAAASGLHFLTSDTPVVLKNVDRISGPASGVALGDADTLIMALTKNVVVSFTNNPDEPSVVELNTEGVGQINALISQAAKRFVVASPRTDLRVSAPWLPRRHRD
jgi:hypothetical protein